MVVLLSLQHLQEQLDLDLSPLEYMMKCYPEIKEKEEMRKIIGRYGLTGKQQVRDRGGKDPRWLRGYCTGQHMPLGPTLSNISKMPSELVL